jgi:ATP-dependent Clp protease ATP-binding subunit ClpB
VYLAERGYDPVFGARPLKRTIQRGLQDPLAMFILNGSVREGDTVYVDVSEDGESLHFSQGELAQA